MITLLKLAWFRSRSPQDYQKMQCYIAEKSITELKKRGINFPSATVLELGAGGGGYSLILKRESRTFIASDLHLESWVKECKVPFVPVDVLKTFPFGNETFDLIYCSSVIEHIEDPNPLLQEAWRVLKPGGYLYLSFPPFFSLALIGGHQFKPFHFFGERLAVRFTNLVRRANYRNYANSFGTFGLYPLTIERVEKFIRAHHFQIQSRYTRMSPVNTAHFPGFLKDLLTWHACFLSQKPASLSPGLTGRIGAEVDLTGRKK
jgi:SAM-dependent methyltransferase